MYGICRSGIVGKILRGETNYSKINLTDCHVVHHKYHATSSTVLANLSFFIAHRLVVYPLYSFVLFTFIFLSNLFYFFFPMCLFPS